MDKLDKIEMIKKKVLVYYTRGELEEHCTKLGFRIDWNIKNCKRQTLEKYLIKKLSKEV